MAFKSNNQLYTDRACLHLKRFIEQHKLFDKHQDLLIAISGGIDSMVLGHLIFDLKRFGYSNGIEFIYINHNTRDEQIKEKELVEAYAAHLGVKFVFKTLTGLNPNSNFEHEARDLRYKAIKQYAKIDQKILFAHHIDDSYEWTILQGLRSSSVESIVGIPLINKSVVRPLMCLTKKQIRKYATCFDLPYMEDPTNEQVKYERNFLRNKIITSLGKRHPQYLKHYVNRHNELARRLGVHVLLKSETNFLSQTFDDYAEIYSLNNDSNYSGIEQLLLKVIKKLNPNQRGTLEGQFKKIIQALKNNKHGPLTLSGGLKVYVSYNYLFITVKDFTDNLVLKKHSGLFTRNEFVEFLKHNGLPAFLSIQTKDNSFSIPKLIHPMHAVYSGFITQERLRYIQPLSLLRQWSKAKNLNKSLKLSLFYRS